MKTLSDLFASTVLKNYLGKVDALVKLNILFESLIQKELVSHCKIANFEGNKMILYVTNCGWATRVRYAIPQIMKDLKVNSHFAALEDIKCKIIPSLPAPTQGSLKSVNPVAAELLEQAASSMVDSNLKTSLMRLASRRT